MHLPGVVLENLVKISLYLLGTLGTVGTVGTTL